MSTSSSTSGASTPLSTHQHAAPLGKEEINEQPYILPKWFLKENVQTWKDLVDLHLEDIRSFSYSELLDITTSAFVRDENGYLPYDQPSVLLYSKSQNEAGFLDSVLLTLAKDLQASLISFDLEDLTDLGCEFDHQERQKISGDKSNGVFPEKKVDRQSHNGLAAHYFGRHERNESPDAMNRNEKAHSAVLDGPRTKHQSSSDAAKLPYEGGGFRPEEAHPVIVHVRDFGQMNPSKASFLARLTDSVRSRRTSGDLFVLVATTSAESIAGSETAEKLKGLVAKHVKDLAVTEDTSMEITSLNPSTRISNQAVRRGKTNCRRLKRALRLRMPCLSLEILEPYSDWSQLCEGKIELLGSKALWDHGQMQRAITQIVGRTWWKNDLDIKDIRIVLKRLQLLNCISDPETGIGKMDSKKADGEPKISLVPGVETWEQKMQRIQCDCNEYEKTFLECIVNPNKLHSSYDDVIVDQDIKDTVMHLISFQATTSKIAPSYLTTQVRINGALLYGPPGTGKTHLCRAIAKDSGAVMLSVNSANIRSKWVGETEKIIKAAFTLASKLHPCVLFMDEVDSLFYRRQSDNKSWERAAITQFLQEMDGLGTSDKAPFVVVATNRPQDLDDAFMRRLPQKIRLGLPSAEARCQILKGLLKDESLDALFSVDSLAERTEGYSGSDLRSLCAETAMISAIELNKQIKEGSIGKEVWEGKKLLLKVSHFAKALSKIRPTVSEHSIKELEAFTRRFNP